MTYAEKLKDDRWLKRRNEILEIDNHKCRHCLHRHELQVHHRSYISGADPWQYPDEFLITLCATCHKGEEHFKKLIKEKIYELSLYGYSFQDIFDHLNSLKK